MKGVFPWLVRWACHDGARVFCSAFSAQVGPVQNIIFLTVHYLNYSRSSVDKDVDVSDTPVRFSLI